MRTDPRLLLRGLGKFVAVVLAAGLVGAGLGIALAELSGNDDPGAPILPATTSTAATQTSTTSTSTATQTTPASGTYRVPRVEILEAQLVTTEAGVSRVTARVRVTNRGTRPLTIKAPVLVSGDDEVRLDTPRGSARSLLTSIDPGERASGVVRFTTSDAVTQRLTETPRARLRIANRTVSLTLTTPDGAEETPG